MSLDYFSRDEFDSPDLPGSGAEMDSDFLRRLDACRHEAGVPFIITSGYRSEAWNRKVGGVDNSSHLLGLAADIKAVTARHRYRILFALISGGFTRIGIGPNFIHVDADKSKPARVCWVY